MTKTKRGVPKNAREVLERLYEESWSNDDIPRGEYEIKKKRFIDSALADIEALEQEEVKFKKNLLRVLTGDCNKKHNPTFREVCELACPICNKNHLEPSKEDIYQCIVDYGKTTNKIV